MDIRDFCEAFLQLDIVEYPKTDFFEHLTNIVFYFIEEGEEPDEVVKCVIASAFSVAQDCEFYIHGYEINAAPITCESLQSVHETPEKLCTYAYLRNALLASPLINDVFDCIKEAVLHFKALCKMRGVKYTDVYIVKSVLGSAFELTQEFVFYVFGGCVYATYVGR